jgi:hypothetical protein
MGGANRIFRLIKFYIFNDKFVLYLKLRDNNDDNKVEEGIKDLLVVWSYCKDDILAHAYNMFDLTHGKRTYSLKYAHYLLASWHHGISRYTADINERRRLCRILTRAVNAFLKEKGYKIVLRNSEVWHIHKILMDLGSTQKEFIYSHSYNNMV